MSPPTAQRDHGVTEGPLWRQTAKLAASSPEDRKSFEYSVLVGNTLTSYSDVLAYKRGDHPTSFLRIVGASAWNPTGTTGSDISSAETTFRLVTFQGTQVYCTAPSSQDRDLWLSALHAGLEASYSRPQEHENTLLKPPSPEKRQSKRNLFGGETDLQCTSCGRCDSEKNSVQFMSSPLPQYGIETRCDVCSDCLIGQGFYFHVQMLCDMYASEVHERCALVEARGIALKTVRDASPPPEEEKQKEDSNSGTSSSDDHTSGDGGTSGDQSSWTQVGSDASTAESGEARSNMTGSWMAVDSPPRSSEQHWINIPPTVASTKALLDLVKSAAFSSYRRLCPLLDLQCGRLEAGDVGCAAEFFEALDEESGISQGDELGELKKQALVVAGDMGAVMKLLQDHALPGNTELLGDNHTEMLAYLLEFLLDLCEEGELSSVAFFWPQLQRIHLRMLPPTNTNQLARVELFEDFLMTISTKYSVHLAIELAWGYVGDLEDSLYNANSSAECKRRRFAVMRFLCELESLLFDFPWGWGGGSVSLRGMFGPSKHQNELLREGIKTLQQQRKSRIPSPCLSRSVRMDKLKQHSAKFTRPPEEAAQEALRITSNADYFSSHISFTRRLGEIAEKLRFMDVEKRAGALKRELGLLNSSGSMGGDPLNRVLEHGLIRVVRAPRDEGHVFRSKERTPVLLLMEVTLEGVEDVECAGDVKENEDAIVKDVGGTPDQAVKETADNEGNVAEEAVSNATEAEMPTSGGDSSAQNDETDDSSKPANESEDKMKKAVEEVDNSGSNERSDNEGNVAVEAASNATEAEMPIAGGDSSAQNDESDDSSMSANESEDKTKKAVDEVDSGSNERSSENNEASVAGEAASNATEAELKIAGSDSSAQNDESDANSKSANESEGKTKEAVDEVDSGSNERSSENNEATAAENKEKEGESNVMEEELPIEKTPIKVRDPSEQNEKMDDTPKSANGLEEAVSKTADELDSSAPANSIEEPCPPETPLNSRGHKSMASPSPRHAQGTLRKFESPAAARNVTTSTPDKETVEDLVANMMAHQLHIPELDKIDDPMSDQGSDASDDAPGESQTMNSSKRLFEGEPAEDEELPDSAEASSPRSSLARGGASPALRSSQSRKMSAFGSVSSLSAGDLDLSASNDDLRREVLATIMVKGMRGRNVIARGAAPAAQKNLQALDRKRAVELILDSEDLSKPDDEDNDEDASKLESSRSKLALSLGVDSSDVAISNALGMVTPSEEDEAMESLRLLLIQNRVAQGTLSAENAALVLAPVNTSSLNQVNSTLSGQLGPVVDSDAPQIDAGDVDSRLAGCGPLPPAVLSALILYKGDMCSHDELLEIVKKDIQHSATTSNTSKLIEDSAFWGRFAFGERWAEKKARIAASSPKGSLSGWDLIGIIVKSNDDLRQEAFVMQLIDLCQEAFDLAGLDELWLHPYRILSSGRTTGIIEMVRNAMSFDALKKRPGYQGRLRGHLKKMCEFATDPSEAFHSMQRNFVRSLASYSVLSYIFLFKDRHNGNMLLDTAGHVIHIDFGFVFGVAPGGSFSLEMSTPFKLTEDMIDVMGGLASPHFSEFVTLFCCGFLALQAHAETFLTIVEITCQGSSFKCFDGRDPNEVVESLRDRFKLELSREESVNHCLDLIHQSVSSYGTKQYDYFQYLSQGIAA